MKRKQIKAITWTAKYCGKCIGNKRGMSKRAKRGGNKRLRQALKKIDE